MNGDKQMSKENSRSPQDKVPNPAWSVEGDVSEKKNVNLIWEMLIDFLPRGWRQNDEEDRHTLLHTGVIRQMSAGNSGDV